MSLKRFIPGTAEHIVKKHMQYLHRKVRGHDVLLLVEWADGQLTELPAKYDTNGNVFRAKNGLTFAVAGEGAEPRSYYGVPTILVYGALACPVDTTNAIAADVDTDGNFVIVSENGRTVAFAEGEADPDEVREVLADGGVPDKVYDLHPPDGTVGWAYSLSTAANRAPYPVNPDYLKAAEERGKASGRDQSEMLKHLLIGAGLAFLLLAGFYGLTWMLGQIGGGEASGAMLFAFASTHGVSRLKQWAHAAKVRVCEHVA